MSTQYKATCKCGATVDVPYSDSFKDWLNSHKECLKQQAMPRTWVGLTDEEIGMAFRVVFPVGGVVFTNGATEFAQTIERKLKDKNL